MIMYAGSNGGTSQTSQTTPPPATPPNSAVGSDGGSFAATSFSSPDITSASNGNVQTNLIDGVPVHAPINGLASNKTYQLFAEVAVLQSNAAMQVAVITQASQLAAIHVNSTGLQTVMFNTPGSTSDMQLRLVSNGQPVLFTRLEILPL